jgi:hypothetical protein
VVIAKYFPFFRGEGQSPNPKAITTLCTQAKYFRHRVQVHPDREKLASHCVYLITAMNALFFTENIRKKVKAARTGNLVGPALYLLDSGRAFTNM